MEKIQHLLENLQLLGLQIGFIVFSSIAHVTKLIFHAQEKKRNFTKRDVLINGIPSLFAGFMFLLGSLYFSDDWILITIMACLGAFMGLSGLEKISNVLLDSIVGQLVKRGKDPKDYE